MEHAPPQNSPAVITAQYIQYCFDTQPKAGPYINYSWVEVTLIYGPGVPRDGPPFCYSAPVDIIPE